MDAKKQRIFYGISFFLIVSVFVAFGKDAREIPLEKAYAIIREESGTHFDPAVVEAFFVVAEDIEKMRETEYPENN